MKEKRSFGGQLNVFVDYKNNPIGGRIERNFEEKHLRAYIRGDRRFSFGFDKNHFPIWYDVKEVWSKI